MRLGTFETAGPDVMQERRRDHVRVAMCVVGGVEERVRLPTLRLTPFEVVHEWVRARHLDLRLVFDVPRAVEQRVGAPAFSASDPEGMLQRLLTRSADVRVWPELPRRIEERMPPPALGPADDVAVGEPGQGP